MDYQIINSLTEKQTKELRDMYQEEWWTVGRELEGIQTMLEHSVIVAISDPETEELLAFSRILTDYIYKALIFDVIAKPNQRGKGLGRVLMDAIMNLPEIQNVQHFELYCRPQMVPFYQQWGFTTELGELQFMRSIK